MDKKLDYIALGARIRRTREAKHITQEQLGEACSLSTAHIGHVERGTRTLSVETLFKIACALHVSVDYLLFDSFDNDDNLLNEINSILKTKEKGKVRTFLTTVRALADKIDEL